VLPDADARLIFVNTHSSKTAAPLRFHDVPYLRAPLPPTTSHLVRRYNAHLPFHHVASRTPPTCSQQSSSPAPSANLPHPQSPTASHNFITPVSCTRCSLRLAFDSQAHRHYTHARTVITVHGRHGRGGEMMCMMKTKTETRMEKQPQMRRWT